MVNSSFINAYITKIFNDIQNWAYANSVIINAGGFTIGYLTYNFVIGIVTLITPIFILFGNNISKLANIIGLTRTGYLYILIKFIVEFILQVIVWLFTILITFIFLEYFLNNNILKLKTNIKEKEKKDFIISKVKVEKDSKSSILENKKKIDILNEKDKIIGEEIVRKEEELIDNLSIIKNKDYEKFINEIL